ncbi:hypothetical protein EVAR_24783_1 [Eumeta japonica]|uniref:Endonuclease/exonuclease/phosphatase domain-containing protein n=1 Tax=Eumeta variegata TaxID=151549 RepID=A0A4C1W204_EUMVA|nr:hypothetical protein EVAR_24783_1 [Eumeta japonica]
MAGHRLRIGQINLQGVRLASIKLQKNRTQTKIRHDSRTGTEIVRYMQHSSTAETVVVNFDSNVTCAFIPELINDYCTCVHVRTARVSVYLVSACFKYIHSIVLHVLHLEKVMNKLKEKKVDNRCPHNCSLPPWHSDVRHYTNRGSEAEEKRAQQEGFIALDDLQEQNVEGQPCIFSNLNGMSNIDVMLTTRSIRVVSWEIVENASSSYHQLIYDLKSMVARSRKAFSGNGRIEQTGLVGLAYRTVVDKIRAPSNIINCITFRGVLSHNINEAVKSMLGTLLPDNDVDKDEVHNRQIKLAALIPPNDTPTAPLNTGQWWKTVRSLPNTSLRIDRVTARII